MIMFWFSSQDLGILHYSPGMGEWESCWGSVLRFRQLRGQSWAAFGSCYIQGFGFIWGKGKLAFISGSPRIPPRILWDWLFVPGDSLWEMKDIFWMVLRTFLPVFLSSSRLKQKICGFVSFRSLGDSRKAPNHLWDRQFLIIKSLVFGVRSVF